jgi:hypothetical protein
MARTFRRFAAIVAAYAVALQMLFAAFAVPGQAFGNADMAAMCLSNSGSGAPVQPSSHDACCPGCIAGHCAHLLFGTPRTSAHVPWPARSTRIGQDLQRSVAPVRMVHDGSNAARAPPAC